MIFMGYPDDENGNPKFGERIQESPDENWVTLPSGARFKGAEFDNETGTWHAMSQDEAAAYAAQLWNEERKSRLAWAFANLGYFLIFLVSLTISILGFVYGPVFSGVVWLGCAFIWATLLAIRIVIRALTGRRL